MKHTDLYHEYKKLDAIEAKELIAAVKAHGNEYIFIHFDEDGDYDVEERDNAPIIAAATKYMDAYEDFYISRVEVYDEGYYTLYGWPKEGFTDEVEIDSVAHGHLGYVTDCIPETDMVRDVTITAGQEKVYVAFSSEAANAVHGADEDKLSEILESNADLIVVRTFNSKAEKDAYLKGLDDLDGWTEYATLDPNNTYDIPLIDIIDKHYGN